MFEITKERASVIRVRVDLKNYDDHFVIANMPDAHWDNPKCDRSLLKAHLEYANADNFIKILPGDTFCMMQGKYDPRRSKEDIRPEHNKNNYLQAVIKDAVDWFKPYSKNMIIGQGNHESAILKNCEYDVISEFSHGVGAVHGGYQGWVIFDIGLKGNTSRTSLTYYFHHGYGGGGTITRGAINHSRYMMQIEGADIITSGHIHEKSISEVMVQSLHRHGQIKPKVRPIIICQSSTYKQELQVSGFHTERGRPPKSLGATFVRVGLDNKIKSGKRILTKVMMPYFFSTKPFTY